MNVFDGDPGQLSWKSEPGNRTVIGIYQPGEGFLKEHAISGQRAPTDQEFMVLMEKAKELSIEHARPIYLVLFRVKRGVNDRFTTFAEFSEGQLSAFCRPPWRKGEGLM